MKRARRATRGKTTRTILTSIAISKPGRDPGPIGTFRCCGTAKIAESIGSSKGESQRRRHPASAVCRRCFEPGKPGGRQNGGLQASPPKRGMRTTLVSGVLLCIEVETFPRHHKQRRAPPVYIRRGRQSSLGLTRCDGLQHADHGPDALGHLALVAGQLLTGAEQLVGDVEGGQGQGLDGVLPPHLPLHALRALLDISGEVTDVLGVRLAADRVLLSEDLDLDAVGLAHSWSFSISLSMALTCDSTSLRSCRSRASSERSLSPAPSLAWSCSRSRRSMAIASAARRTAFSSSSSRSLSGCSGIDLL